MKPVEELLAEVKNWNCEERYDRVMELLTEDFLESYNDRFLYWEAGYACYRTKQHELALRYFDTSIKAGNDGADAYFWRGESFIKLNRYDEALSDFTIAIENKGSLVVKENLFMLHHCRGTALAGSGRHREAIKDYDKALKLKPGNSKVYSERACCWQQLKKPDKALADFEAALLSDPEDVSAYISRAIFRQQQGELQSAMTDINKAISLEADCALAYSNRASVWTDLEQYERALRDHNKAVELEPDEAHFYYARGFTLNHLKQYGKALADFEKTLKLQPGHREAEEEKKELKRKLMQSTWR